MPILTDLFDLVLPSSCVCCRRAGPTWCPDCRPSSVPGPARLTVQAPPTFAAADYGDELRGALLGYKERGRRDLAAPLAEYLSDAVDEAGRTLLGTAAPVLVPVPSRRVAARERGGDHVRRLSRLVARHGQLRVVPALRVSGRVRDSAGLGAEQRAANLSHRMAAAPAGPDPRPPVLIVDDIVTTGATMAEAERALTAAGWSVAGAAVVAATPRRWPGTAKVG